MISSWRNVRVFNVIRKHIKVEPQRWYYHCDRLGLMVWQDMPNLWEPDGEGFRGGS